MNHDYTRQDRISALLRREMATLIWKQIKDPRLGPVSVTDVEVSRDLSHAVVYLNTSDDDSMESSLNVLKGARGFLRRELGKIMKTRTVPELHFKCDDSLQKGDRIEELLFRARQGDQWSAPDQSDGSDDD